MGTQALRFLRFQQKRKIVIGSSKVVPAHERVVGRLQLVIKEKVLVKGRHDSLGGRHDR